MNNFLIIYLINNLIFMRLFLNFFRRGLSRIGLLACVSLGYGGSIDGSWLRCFKFLMLFHVLSVDHFQFDILLRDCVLPLGLCSLLDLWLLS